ncbi:MAG: hypothetical protein HZA36_02425 [Parcubacteria group bacterium]|nr:hypothetical protein [Parcubacteria group bacterium]
MQKKKTTNKQSSKELNQHRDGVLLEYMSTKFDLLLEGQQALHNKIDTNHEEFREFKKEVDFKFEAVFGQFDEIRSEFKDVHSELHVIRNELKGDVHRDEFLLLEHRVEKLEHNNKNKK